MEADYPTDWERRRKEVYERDNYSCQNCGAIGGPNGNTELHAHHVVPKSKGGGHHLSNLKTLCKDCHGAVHGGEGVQARSKDSSGGAESLSNVPELAQRMEYELGATPIFEIGICTASPRSGILETLKKLVGTEVANPDLCTLARSTVPTDTVDWTVAEDETGYRWISAESDDYEELLFSAYSLVQELTGSNNGFRLLAVLIPFSLYDADASHLYWVYSNRFGGFYPFAPLQSTADERSPRLEFRASAIAEGAVAIEPDEERWYPLWPPQPDLHPWNLP